MLQIKDIVIIETEFEKAKSKHEELLKERKEENRKMELQQIEENLKGITELVNKLFEEVKKMKQDEVIEEPKKYQMNVHVAKPMNGEGVWWLNNFGELCSANWANAEASYELYKNTNLFKDKESAETYQELLNDMKRLSKKFEPGEYNWYLFCDEWDSVGIQWESESQRRDYCFNLHDGEYILNKYPGEVLHNFIKYCK